MDTSRPRKPFVQTITQDMANGFMIAGVLGSAYHFDKGGFKAVFKYVPRVTCSSAYLFGVFGAIDYAMVSARRKDEPVLDCAVAGAGAFGITALPRGLRQAGQSALVGAAIGGVALGGLRILRDRGWSLSLPPVVIKQKQTKYTTMDTSRQRKPFVETITQDMANGFMIAGVLGSAYHFSNGGFKAVFKYVPRATCSLAYLFGVYGAIDYAMVSARRKEEPVMDCAVAGAGAFGITALPRGLRQAGQCALVGAAIGGVALGGLRILRDRVSNLSTPVVIKPKQADDPCRAAATFRPTLPVEVPWTPVADEEIRS